MRSFSGFLVVMALVVMFASTASAQLAGSYTINPNVPAGGTNYTSFGAAVADLVFQGVSGPVTFDVFDDAGPYTETNPFTTSNVTWNPGTAVIVLAQWSGASSANRVTFRAGAGESPVIDASGQAFGVFFNGADYVTLEGLEITNAAFDAITLYSEAQHGQVLDAIIRRCRIHDCTSAGIVVYGNSPQPTNTLIENNFFWNLQTGNTGGFSTTARFGYISSRRDSNTMVQNNTFFVSAGTGSGFCVMGTVPSGSETPWTIQNNVIVKTVSSGRPIYSFPDVGGTILLPNAADTNCYWDTSGGNFALFGLSSASVATDLASWQSQTGLDLASLPVDPALVNPVMGDLHLNMGSPCIDAGQALVVDDIDGDARTGLHDIGADEAATNLPGITLLGQGCPTSTGQVPTLFTTQIPLVGNVGFTLQVAQVPPAAGLLVFGTIGMSPGPTMIFPGCFVHADVNQLIQYINLGILPFGPFPADSAGMFTLPLPIDTDPGLVGTEFVWQIAFPDMTPSGVALTNGLSMVIQ